MTGARLALALMLAAATACDAPADASVLVDLASFANHLPGLRAPAATLDVIGEDGAPMAVEVKDDSGERVLVQSPLPVPCGEDGLCSVEVRVRPETVRFAMHVAAADRCDARGELVQLDGEPVELGPHSAAFVDLWEASFTFDDDADGIVNVLELATCGRFDVADREAPPQTCSGGASDPCCAEVSPLEGHLTAFAGGDHLRADGSTASVAPFALDATEVTWRQFGRCVVAGACLPSQPEHPARVALAGRSPTGAAAAEPVVGLNPAEAQQLCSFFGKRLPLDDEWDFAAAHRADVAVRGRYPWADDDAEVSCDPALVDTSGVAANFSVPGTACAGAPRPVGSFASSHANSSGERGAGGAVADLGGNVAEWTLVAGASAPSIDEVPAGHDVVVLRGGGARSPLALLENDVPVRVPFPTSGGESAWRDTIVRLATTAGVRCAIGVADGSVEPSFAAEPACGAQ